MDKDPATLTLSPTKVDTYFGCRRLFKYRYLVPPFTPSENRYFLIGNIAHKALELYHGGCSETKWKKRKLFMGQCFKSAVKKHNAMDRVKDGLIDKSDLFSIKLMIENYLMYLKKLDKNGEYPNVFQVEKLAKLEIGGAVVYLKADRVDILGDKKYKVVDYKTGRPASKKDERESVQIPSYGIWLKQQFDESAEVTGEYAYLKHMGHGRGLHSYEITDEAIAQATSKYQFVQKELINGAEFRQNFKYKYCRNCDFSKFCVEDDNDDL